jgi:hypothetical protein
VLKGPGVLNTTRVLTARDVTGEDMPEIELEIIGGLLGEMTELGAMLEAGAMLKERAVLEPSALLEGGIMREL